jgi:glutamyl-tRNA(Gln) amidotransferase subunit E
MRAEHGDALVLVWGSDEDTAAACNEVALRAREATVGVPNDTRQALKDGTNGFERVLPGADRMYPDTDLPPLAIRAERLERVRAGLPEPVWERAARYRDLRLPGDTVHPLTDPRWGALFDRVRTQFGLDPVFLAVTLVQRLRDLRRRFVPVDTLTDDEITAVLEAYAKGLLSREGVVGVLRLVAEHPPVPGASGPARVAAVFADHRLTPLGPGEVEQALAIVLGRLDCRWFKKPQQKCRWLTGELMHELRGRLSGAEALRLVHERLRVPLGPGRPAARGSAQTQAARR